jgi:hypothetical protein
MLEEKNVLDEEYFREFLAFYATTFVEHPPTATRLHFFATEGDLVVERLRTDSGPLSREQEVELGYLGYMVIRPTSPPTVGETLLRVPSQLDGLDCFSHCATMFGQTVNGKRLHVGSVPFIGRNETGVCAQAAIWGACKYLHKYRYYPKVSLPEITAMAGQLVAETRFTRPAGGLTHGAIYSVLRELGFQIHVADVQAGDAEADSALEEAYTAVESGLPAFLLLKNGKADSLGEAHAVWVAGHNLAWDLPKSQQVYDTLSYARRTIRYLSASRWVPALLVHDDVEGPYVPTTLASGKSSALQFPCYHPYAAGKPPREHSPGYIPNIAVTQVVVPLPEEVFVKPPEAKRMALFAILGGHLLGLREDLECSDAVDWDTDTTLAFIQAIDDPARPLAFRTYLCMSARFQEYAVSSHPMCADIKRIYAQKLRMPEYVWVTEISDVNAMISKEGHERRVIGEMLIDSTDAAARQTNKAFRYLALHVPGLLVWRQGVMEDEPPAASGDEVQYIYTPIHEDNPYGPYDHNSDADDPPRSHRALGPMRFRQRSPVSS